MATPREGREARVPRELPPLEIVIDRIDVTISAPAPQPPSTMTSRDERPTPLSLEEYLARRSS